MSLLLWIAFSIMFIVHASLSFSYASSFWTCVFLLEISLYVYIQIYFCCCYRCCWSICHHLTQWLYLLHIIYVHFSTKSILFTSLPPRLLFFYDFFSANVLKYTNIHTHSYIFLFALIVYATNIMHSSTQCYLFILLLILFPLTYKRTYVCI